MEIANVQRHLSQEEICYVEKPLMFDSEADMIANDVLLRIEDLNTYFYTYYGVVKAVDGIDLFIRRGETLGLVGESGCGKSVTALSIMQLIPKEVGRIVKGQMLFEGQDLLKLSDEKMRQIRGNKISMIFQEPMTSLNPVFQVGFQIAEVFRIHHGLTRRSAWDRAEEMLTKVRIPDPEKRLKEYPFQMSGGMRQRIMIAMALACNPKLIIADEATTALDVTIQAQILELMKELKDKEAIGTSILLITHDLAVVAEMAHWVAVMYCGKIVEYADVVELFIRPKHPYTVGLLACIAKIDRSIPQDRLLYTIPGVVPSPQDLTNGCSFQDRCDQRFGRCTEEIPPLFDVGSGHLVRCWQYGG